MSDDIEDLMSSLGLDKLLHEKTPEEAFITYITWGANPKTLLMCNWLGHEMAHLDFLRRKNIRVMTNTLKNGTPQNVDIDAQSYARVMLEYYLYMYYCPRFERAIGIAEMICDMKTTLDLVMGLKEVQDIINKKN